MIVNLTPHEVNIKKGDGFVSIPASGKVARCTATTVITGELEGFIETRTVYGQVQDLPDPEEGVFYIVSSLVALALPFRHDLRIPNESIRDESGKIICCRSLGRVDQVF